ncbi:MAG: hypothetical protein HGA22_12425 [Clostridiales bacterium]|nr:hypothetical protein [Clostridiales bacterium]
MNKTNKGYNIYIMTEYRERTGGINGPALQPIMTPARMIAEQRSHFIQGGDFYPCLNNDERGQRRGLPGRVRSTDRAGSRMQTAAGFVRRIRTRLGNSVGND